MPVSCPQLTHPLFHVPSSTQDPRPQRHPFRCPGMRLLRQRCNPPATTAPTPAASAGAAAAVARGTCVGPPLSPLGCFCARGVCRGVFGPGGDREISRAVVGRGTHVAGICAEPGELRCPPASSQILPPPSWGTRQLQAGLTARSRSSVRGAVQSWAPVLPKARPPPAARHRLRLPSSPRIPSSLLSLDDRILGSPPALLHPLRQPAEIPDVATDSIKPGGASRPGAEPCAPPQHTPALAQQHSVTPQHCHTAAPKASAVSLGPQLLASSVSSTSQRGEAPEQLPAPLAASPRLGDTRARAVCHLPASLLGVHESSRAETGQKNPTESKRGPG